MYMTFRSVASSPRSVVHRINNKFIPLGPWVSMQEHNLRVIRSGMPRNPMKSQKLGRSIFGALARAALEKLGRLVGRRSDLGA